jgi:hypothetical protein
MSAARVVDLGRLSLVAVVPLLELKLAPDGRSFGPCPSCGAEHRNNPGRSHDRRLRCRIHEDRVWGCCSNGSEGCGAGGSVFDLVAWVLLGRPLVRGDVEAWRGVLAWLSDERVTTPPPRPSPSALAPKTRLNPFKLARDLFHFPRVDADDEVATWLAARAIDPRAVADLELACVLPEGFHNSATTYRGRQWDETGHRLIVPMHEAHPDRPRQVRVASIHARCVRACDDDAKAAWPAGASATGLLMLTNPTSLWADGAARRLVTIVEGVPDFLTMALASPTQRGALIGAVSGSAQPETAALIPEGWTVVLALHDDDGGRQQRTAWEKALRGRVDVRHFNWAALST